MQENEFLGFDPLAGLQIDNVALRGGGGGAMDMGDPLMDALKVLGTAAATTAFGPAGGAAATAGSKLFYRGTTGVPQNYANGTQGVPGQRTGQDTVPAMLSPGEAVIPASAAQDPANQGAIQGMVQEGRQDQGAAAQILQALGLPMDPQLIAMIEDMLAQGIPTEVIIQQLQERVGQSKGAPQGMPQAGQGAPQGIPQAPSAPQGLYGGTPNVQGPLSGKGRREQQKFQSDEARKDTAFQADQRRKDDTHRASMQQKSESAMYARSMRGE